MGTNFDIIGTILRGQSLIGALGENGIISGLILPQITVFCIITHDYQP